MRIIITGASSGIGRAAAEELAKRGHQLAIVGDERDVLRTNHDGVGRNKDRVHEVAKATNGDPYVTDFDDLAQVRQLANELLANYPTIDGLGNNAGGIFSKRERTVDEHERTWQANVLAPFVLTQALLPRLLESDARVVFTSSDAHRNGVLDLSDPEKDSGSWRRGWAAYGPSKRADLMLAKEYARRTPMKVYSFHPGVVATGFANLNNTPIAGIMRLLFRSPEQGAELLVRLLTEDPDAASGSYFAAWGKADKGAIAQALDPAEGAKLWELLERQAVEPA